MTVNRNYSSVAARATLQSNISGVATSMTVDTTSGWPSTPFTLIIDPDTASEEVVDVTGVSGLTLTIVRGRSGTSATTHAAGAVIEHGFSSRDFSEPQEHIAASTGVHGISGAVVGTTDTQALSNKTLTTPTIADLTNANHTHAGATSGGLLPTAAPTSSAVGDASTTGTAASYSRTDHKHAREAFAIAGNSAVGDAAAAGSASTVSHSDHVHGRESFGNVTAQTTFGASSSNGAASTPARSDHAHGTPASPFSMAYKSGTEGIGSTTLQDDDDLTLAVEANTVYAAELVLLYDGATAGDMKLDFTVPASATFKGVAMAMGTGGASSGDDYTADFAAGAPSTLGCLGAGVTMGALFKGTLITGASSGNITLQWAQNAASGTQTRVLSHSHLALIKRTA